MTDISPLDEVTNLQDVTSWMLSTLKAYQDGTINRKLASGMAKRVLRKIKNYSPTKLERDHIETVEDLCISLGTIDRAEGNFEKFYLDSLKEELERVAKLLEGKKNE
jgi:hypothetical protein